MMARARHEIVVLSDSDIRVEPQYLQSVISTLLARNVGLVTCLYCGFSLGGLWARLSAAGINEHFLPGALVGLKLGLASRARAQPSQYARRRSGVSEALKSSPISSPMITRSERPFERSD